MKRMSREGIDFVRSKLSYVKKSNRIQEFWVVTCYYNPCHYENRLKNYIGFQKQLKKQNVNLMTIELIQSEGQNHIPSHMSDLYMYVVEPDVLWAKERLLNIAIENLPPECTQVCWCDCDIIFERDNWATICSNLLKEYRIVQPFSSAIFLGPNESPTNHREFSPVISWGRFYIQNMNSKSPVGTDNILKSHPGYAWAARRSVIKRIGGLYDKCILGNGDIVLALAFSHNNDKDGPIPHTWETHWVPGWSDALYADIRKWQQNAAAIIKGSVSFVNGNIFHLWHGPKKNRYYTKRGKILENFDPDKHLCYSESNTWRWTQEAIELDLHRKCIQYFKSRREDDVNIN